MVDQSGFSRDTKPPPLGGGRSLVGNDEFSTYSSLLAFDVSFLPPSSVIQSAQLKLWHKSVPGSRNKDICVRRVSSAWDSTLTIGATPSIESACLSSVTVGEETGRHVWGGLHQLVQGWLSAESNFGLELSLADALGVLETKAFYSADSHSMPELLITYTLQ